MEMVVKDSKINFDYYDNKSNFCLVFLHGWGQNIAMIEPLAKPFLKKYSCLLIDLPGFGKSPEPPFAWTLNDYAEMINILVKKLKLKDLIIVGHSFGGKVALVYALNYEAKKLILLASPYTKKIKKPTLKMRFYKFVKNTPGLKVFENFVKNRVGSVDYRNASPLMRNILVKHINQDLVDDLPNIKIPVLLVWGTNDTAVSYEDAKKLEKILPNAGLVTYEGATHYAYLERLHQTVMIINSFIGSD